MKAYKSSRMYDSIKDKSYEGSPMPQGFINHQKVLKGSKLIQADGSIGERINYRTGDGIQMTNEYKR